MDFDTVKTETERIMRAYMAVPSITGTAREREVEPFLESEVRRIPYFGEHPDHWGFRAIPDDPYGRRVFWAMVRGAGKRAVVCLHHSDVVPVENYGDMQGSALDPDAAKSALEARSGHLDAAAARDLASGEWMFGRGSCDMKSGGAAQLALLAQYAEEPDLPGAVLVVAVPDEEDLSAGMREAASLLTDLQERFGLEYALMIDSEPHARPDSRTITLSVGSIGKMLVAVDAYGVPVHSGAAERGLNAVGMISRVVARTEGNLEFVENDGEFAPPPTWLQLRDGKPAYDISMPASAHGCLSVLSAGKQPAEVLGLVRESCGTALRESLDAAAATRKGLGLEPACPWTGHVFTFGELAEVARRAEGDSFDQELPEEFSRVRQGLARGELTMLSANRALVDFAHSHAHLHEPALVYGLVPPFYPPVSNAGVAWGGGAIGDLCAELDRFAGERFGLACTPEKFFMGISDMSYAQIDDASGVEASLREAMPLFERGYSLPLRAIQAISMPVINIGPWGKDLHQPTERVNMQDAFTVAPRLIDHAIRLTLA